MTERFVKTAAVALAIISSGEMLMGTRAMYVRGAQSVAIAAQGGAPPVAAAPDLRAVRVNGTVLNYLDVYKGTGEPAGRPVVFVHGSSGTLDDWRDQVRAMADRRRVITYSRRYHVPNAQVDDGHVYSAALHASDLAAFVQALDVTPVDLVGGSYGGLVAIEMTRRHPALVRALVLQEPPATGLLHGSPGAEALADAAEK